ncbi:MAG: ATP-binding cassette domain-containing protein [Lachnospiraceae bacterium]|nr:ATP-binding cassette domain-containing protein [Lachnospiraceae bacterium]
MDEHHGIEVKNVYKSFGKEQVLKNISLSIPPGSIYGVVGNNGSGKTVLMKCICGFMKCDRGSILVNGKQIGKEIDFPDHLGVIIETPGFIPNLNGYKNLKILASLKGRIGRKEIRETLRKVGLDPDMKKPVIKYSLGMRQRLGIAQAIMENPKVLVLDEPFNGLDRHGVVEMRMLLKELKAEGKAILLASHNAQDIEELCDHVQDLMLAAPNDFDGNLVKE